MPKRLNTLNPLNRNYYPNKGLIMRLLSLPNNGGGRQWFDIAGNNHSTLNNGVIWSSLRRDNAFGSLSFDGVNDYINIGLLAPFAAASPVFSIGMWVKRQSNVSGGLLSDRNSAASWAYAYDASGNLQVFISSWNISSATLPLNTWAYAAITYTSSPIKYYLNGQLKSTISATIPQSSGAFQSIGAWDVGTSASPNCLMDDVCVWDRVLSDSELYEVYQDSLRGYVKSLNWLRNSVQPAAASAIVPNSCYYRLLIGG